MAEGLWMKDLAALLHEHYSNKGYSISTKAAPWFLVKIASYFKTEFKLVVKSWNRVTTHDTTTT